MTEQRGRGQLDGGWWPQSRYLAVELADLVDHFPPHLGRIVRAVFSPPDWESAPRRIAVSGGYVKVGSFPRDDTHLIHLKTSDRTVLRVLVVPPSLDADRADDVLSVAVNGSADTAFALLDEVSADVATGPWQHWNDDGGSWWEPHPIPPSYRTGV
ncbi:DUF5994 family protein [Nocardioides insulae]|uniref:DUF5994 family protein n=1 Tax=Nocardioides insulae TaxID=394734 RepID=UPI00040393F4|nr:DUF5994 family protein [Nocardioides insulae]